MTLMPLKKQIQTILYRLFSLQWHTHKEMEIKIFQIDCVRCAPLGIAVGFNSRPYSFTIHRSLLNNYFGIWNENFRAHFLNVA